jgi:dipeptidyl-peptidase 4
VHLTALSRFGLALLPIGLLWAQSNVKKSVTIDDFVSHHAAGEIVPNWSPDGTKFIYEKQGTVHLYLVNDRQEKAWFKTDTLQHAALSPNEPKEFGWQNRRVNTESYQWLPNNQDLLAAVGGDIFVVHSNGGFTQITKTDIAEEDPKLSPDGRSVVYRSRSNLYLLDLANKHTRQLTSDGSPTRLNGQLDWVYPEELDLGTAVWWSPDSKAIAFLQFDVSKEFIYPQVDLLGERALSEPERYPQAGTPNADVRLGRISVKDGQSKWMQVGETTNALLARVAWLPDSSAIAVERFSRVQDRLELLFCNADNGKARTVIHEKSKTWINVADNLFFLDSQPEFLWTSERSGFRHIYRYSNQGKLLQQLTQGDWEVRKVEAVNSSAGKIYYTSSEASPLETQLYEIPISGGGSRRVTSEAGTHEIYANDQGSYFVDRYSSFNQPHQIVLNAGAGNKIAQLAEKDNKIQEDYTLTPEEIVEVKTSDGITMYASLMKPANFNPQKKYPAIVYVYGGPGVQSIRNSWKGLSWQQVLAQKGYVVWQLDNRGSRGRGVAFEAGIFHELGKLEVADQRLGVEKLIQLGFVDPERIGITGWSYGGYMTIHSMLLAPDVFKVGVAGAPVTDWHNYDTIYTERYMGLPGDNPKGYDAGSNVKNAALLRGKLLMVHNIEDDNVLFQNSMQMANALEKAERPFFMQLYPQKTHGVTGPLRKSLYQEMTDFLDERLKPDQQTNPGT